MASFDLWRARYFTEWNCAIRPSAARPPRRTGTESANLWKYYLGLPGKSPAPADRLPQGRLWALSNQSFLSISYACDRLAEDVTCLAQVSPDLVNWFSGPSYTQVAQSVDQGDLRNLTIRDLVPADAADRRFLRLQLQRR